MKKKKIADSSASIEAIPMLPAVLQHKKLTKSEIESLFSRVNTGREYYVDTSSSRLVDKLIELWFESEGYDFWHNPYPEVEKWSVNEDGSVDFWYSR